jgi:glucosylceramidase
MTRHNGAKHSLRPYLKLLLCVGCVAWFLNSPALLHSQEVKVYVSSKAGDRLTAKPNLHFESKAAAKAAFTVNDTVKFQKMDGFGASLLEAGLMVINTLPPDKQEEVLRSLFDVQRGAGFTAMKTVLGSTDFQSAGPFFTYDDTPGDVGMKHFSIARDLAPNGEITFIRRARKYGKFALQATMDYPPDWMITNLQDHKKQDVDPKYYDALALYYLRYLQEYARNGIVLDYLSLFNEPTGYTKIPYNEIRDLLKGHVGPLLQKSGVKTKIQLSEAPTRHNAFQNYPILMDDPEARKYVSSIPYHGYDWTKPGVYKEIAQIHAKYPQYPMWMTEVCHAYEIGEPRSMPMPLFDFDDGDLWGNMIMSDLEAGASAWIYWNMVLNEKGGPWAISEIHENPDHNEQHPVVIVDQKTHKITYTGLYYYLAHFSKFVRPGDYRIETTGSADKVRGMAFQAPDGKVTLQLINSGANAATTQVKWHDRTLAVSLPGISISTVVWQK